MRVTNLVTLTIFMLFLIGCDEQPAEAPAPSQPQSMPVETIRLHMQGVELIEEMPGRTVAYRQSDVRPQVEGILVQRNFEEGAFVEEGEQLYLIDPDVYEANLEAARADASRLEAALDQASRTRKRYQGLLKNKSVSKEDYDSAVSAEAQAKAALAAAKAQVKQAEISLEYTQVKAPISGKIGASAFTEGALVTTNQTNSLATITQLDPIYVDVTQAGQSLLKLKQIIKAGKLQTVKNQGMPVSLIIDATGQTYSHVGRLEFSDVTVNETTGTVRLRAVFPNPEDELLPGMFVRGLVSQGLISNAFLIPQKAVMRRPDGTAYVFVVDSESKIVTKDITIEQSQGKDWIVTAGVNDQDVLVVNGLQRITPGMLVTPIPAQVNS